MSNPYAPPSRGRGGPDSGERAPVADGGQPPGPEGGRPPAHDGEPPQVRPGRPPAAPPAEPPVRAPDPEVLRLVSRRVIDFAGLLLAALATAGLPLPWQVASLVLGIAAMGVGAHALHLAWRRGVRGPLLPGLAMGIAVAGLLSLTMTVMLSLWSLQVERQDCLQDALTISARESCELEFADGLTARLTGTD